VTGQSVLLRVGVRFAFDGELVEVVQFDGARVCVRDVQERWRTVSLAGFLARAATAGASPAAEALGTRLAAVPSAQRAAVAERAGHVREVLTGYRSGIAEAALPGEPHVEYGPGRPVRARQAAKAAELGVSERTVRRWVQAYTDSGEAGLLDSRRVTARGSTVDPRWVDACREVLAQHVAESTPTASAVLRWVRERLEDCTLPLRVALADGEAFDSWLRRLAHRNGMPLLRLAPALGLGDRLHVWRNYALTWHLPADLLRRVETQAGLGPASLNAAVLDQFDPLEGVRWSVYEINFELNGVHR
jgi:transposase